MWVVAKDWKQAIDRWSVVIAHENTIEPQDVVPPQGIQLICESNELLESNQKQPIKED